MTAGSNTREEIIRKGAELIHAQGYKATGIQQILDVAGIPKGSFYFYFKSKDDFGCAVIDHFTLTIGEIFTGLFARHPDNASGTAEQAFGLLRVRL